MAIGGTGAALGSAMLAAIDSVADKKDRAALFQALGNAIVAHFVTNGVGAIAVIGVTPGGGVTTGSIT